MWQKRCLIVAPVVAYLAFMCISVLSCGSSGSGSASPAPTATPITLISMRICSAAPSTTAQCDQPPSEFVALSKPLIPLFAQRAFSSNGVITFQDITTSATWFVNNSLLTSTTQGIFTAGPTAGCSCITAASGTVVSPPLLIAIGQSGSLCSPCPPSPP